MIDVGTTNMPFRVFSKLMGKIIVVGEGGTFECSIRKKIKNDMQLVVGDKVLISQLTDSTAVIEKILPRKNILIRPSVANVDQIIIVVAPTPQIDFLLVDKLIINSHLQHLDVVLCINKTDLMTEEFYQEIVSQYGNVVDKIVLSSSKSNDFLQVKDVLVDKLSFFAGQSAVGKTSISNMILSMNKRVSVLSQRINRGKNTTTCAEIYEVAPSSYLIDTPGFNLLDVPNIRAQQLPSQYDEYVAHADKCKFNSCTHTTEPYCEIKRLLSEHALNEYRYDRYLIIYNELKNQKERFDEKN